MKKFLMTFVIAVLMSSSLFIGTADASFLQFIIINTAENQWLDDALELQDDIDLDAPLSQALWIGTHNSFNAYDNGYIADPGQGITIRDQMRRGAREIVFDVHWVESPLPAVRGFRLCHFAFGGAADDEICVFDRSFVMGLTDIKGYLRNHEEDVILLKIEAFIESHDTKFANKINETLGNKLYKPPENNGVCQYLDVSKLTKRGILDRGNNVIVVVDRCEDGNSVFTNCRPSAKVGVPPAKLRESLFGRSISSTMGQRLPAVPCA